MEFKVHVNTLIQNKQNQFLFVREKKPKIYGKLNLPGGHLEFNETITECALREITEETGLVVDLKGIVSITSTVADNFYAVGFVFAAENITSEINIQCSDIIECIWLTAAEIDNLNNEHFVNHLKIKAALENLNKGNITNFDYIDKLILKY